jgi:adenylate kinase
LFQKVHLDIQILGGLVSDDIVINILKEKIKEPESAKGVILGNI